MGKYVPNASQQKEVDEVKAKQTVRKKVVVAGVCPRVERHGNGRVYKTDNRVRYCVCDECGHTWTKSGPPATTTVEDE